MKFQGGREAVGVLKGYDALLNLVLDNATEFLRDPEDPLRMTDQTRDLGLIVARGTAITVNDFEPTQLQGFRYCNHRSCTK